ncbi:MAG: CBS domain-containing protein [Candidatus Omnitrophica bacterium]|nr:CBS domain-containing protein [Candidatus Omnitrophota bacterium]
MPERSVEELLKEKKIYQIVNPKLVQAPPETSIKAAVELMQKNRSGYVVLSKNKKAVGVFTEDDVVTKILGQVVSWDRPVSEFMTKNWAALKMTDPVGAAIDLMGERRLYYIPLLNEKGELENVLSVRTLIRFLAEFYPTEIYNLPPKPNQVMETPEGG